MKNFAIILLSLMVLSSCKKKDDATPSKYTVKYNGNGNTSGYAPVDTKSYNSGSDVTILDNDGYLEKSGFTFIGWNSNSAGTGMDYLPGSVITMGHSNLTLYAKWWDNTSGQVYRVTYYGNGNTTGTVPVDNTSYPAGFSVTVKGNTGGLVSGGNAFLYWSSNTGGWPYYTPGTTITIQNDIDLYAIYNTSGGGGEYVGLNASGQVKTKSSLTSSWSSTDLNNTFGSSVLVGAVWDGSELVGFNASGQVKTKSSLTSSWYSKDLNNLFGSSTLVAVAYDGEYVGFNASGQVKTKSSLTSSWYSKDLNNLFGSSTLVAVVYDGTQYVGFNASGQVKTKSSLTSSWSSKDLNNLFGSSTLVAVVYDGNEYIGMNASGQVKAKSSLTSAWSSKDLNNLFGSSSLVCATFK